MYRTCVCSHIPSSFSNGLSQFVCECKGECGLVWIMHSFFSFLLNAFLSLIGYLISLAGSITHLFTYKAGTTFTNLKRPPKKLWEDFIFFSACAMNSLAFFSCGVSGAGGPLLAAGGSLLSEATCVGWDGSSGWVGDFDFGLPPGWGAGGRGGEERWGAGGRGGEGRGLEGALPWVGLCDCGWGSLPGCIGGLSSALSAIMENVCWRSRTLKWRYCVFCSQTPGAERLYTCKLARITQIASLVPIDPTHFGAGKQILVWQTETALSGKLGEPIVFSKTCPYST